MQFKGFGDDSDEEEKFAAKGMRGAPNMVSRGAPAGGMARGGGGRGALGASMLGMMQTDSSGKGSGRGRGTPSTSPSPQTPTRGGGGGGGGIMSSFGLGRPMGGRPSADSAFPSPRDALSDASADGSRSLGRRAVRPSVDSTSAPPNPGPLVFNLPKHLGTFNFNVPGRQILVMRRFKRLVPSDFGYDIDDLVLVLCNDIAFVATNLADAPGTLVLLHRPCVRQGVLIERAESMYGPCAFRLNFGNLDKFILKATTLEEVAFWIDKLTLYRIAQSRVQLEKTQSSANSGAGPDAMSPGASGSGSVGAAASAARRGGGPPGRPSVASMASPSAAGMGGDGYGKDGDDDDD